MAAAHVENVGSSTSSGTTSHTVTLSAAVAVGGTVLVVAGLQNAVTGISDSKSNSWTVHISEETNTGRRLFVYRSELTTAFAINDTITITTSMMTNSTMTAESYTGVTTTEDAEATATGDSGTPSSGAAVQSNATNLVVGVVVSDGPVFSTEDGDTAGGSGWTTLTKVEGGGLSNIRGHAWKATTSAVSQTYDPTYTSTGEWSAGICSLQASVAAFLAQRGRILTQAVNRSGTY
jgi:hypothetical protein